MNVQKDLSWFVQRVNGRKIWFSQVDDRSSFARALFLIPTKNGWPSVTYPGVEPNSPDAVASVAQESVGAILMYHHECDCLLVWVELLRPARLEMFIFQKRSGWWCRMVRPHLLGLSRARLWDFGYEYEAQVQLRS